MSFTTNRPFRLALIGAIVVGVAALFIASTFSRAPDTGGPRLVHEEASEFAPVVVYEHAGERCMSFNTMDDIGRQTCFRLDAPDKMVFAYTRMMASALFVVPAPRNILIIGLGGGTLPSALGKILPEATVDSVEIDPAVVRVAQAYFGYKPGPRQRVFVQDGRQFVEQARQDGVLYDMVMLDAFDVDYIPPQLLTVEFFQHVKAILADDGVVVANSFAQSELYDRESATYAAVFGEFFNLRSRLDGNRVIIARPAGLPPSETLERNAQALAARLAPFGIDVDTALSRFSRASNWDSDAQPLSD